MGIPGGMKGAMPPPKGPGGPKGPLLGWFMECIGGPGPALLKCVKILNTKAGHCMHTANGTARLFPCSFPIPYAASQTSHPHHSMHPSCPDSSCQEVRTGRS